MRVLEGSAMLGAARGQWPARTGIGFWVAEQILLQGIGRVEWRKKKTT